MQTYRFWHWALYSLKLLWRGRGTVWAVSQWAGDQTLFLLMYSIWMPWFHLCRARPCTQLYPSHWNAKQSSQALLLKHTVLKASLLACHRLCSLQQEPIHHAQRLLIAFWLNMAHIKRLAWKWSAASHSGDIVHFPKSWRECLRKTHLWGALKINLWSYRPNLLSPLMWMGV